ncbi:MAG TPA: hypothetical protein VF950_30205 [Planctomycetota bacterium]
MNPDALARLRAFRLRQREERRAPEPAEVPDGPDRVGIWRPADGGFVRERPWSAGDFWAPLERIGPKRGQRVVLLGESAAAGMFYRPHLSPASVLESLLPGAEVVDLAKISIGLVELIELAYDATQLEPDLIVFFAGNNWARKAGPWADLATTQDWGRILESGGVPALVDSLRAGLREDVEDALDDLASLEIPVVLVVPESNLDGWERKRPPPWLPGDASPRWHAAWEERDVETMRRLDGGLCSTTWRLLGRPREEVEASSWDAWFSGVPQASETLRGALRDGGRRRGFRIVEPRAPFIDYCHYTAEGIGIVAAAIASAILDVPVPPPVPRVPEEVERLARFTAELHRAHMEAPVTPRRPVFDVPWARDFLEAKLAGVPLPLSAAGRRLPAIDPHAAMCPNIDADVLEALGEVPPGTSEPVELASVRYVERTSEGFIEGGEGVAERAYWRAPWARSAFRARRAGGEETLEVLARVPLIEAPRPGDVEVRVNGVLAGTLPSAPRWTRGRFRVSTRPGLNRIELRWPPLAPDGDAALRLVADRYLLGLWADLFPVFGELASLRLI